MVAGNRIQIDGMDMIRRQMGRLIHSALGQLSKNVGAGFLFCV
jgi:hypothetical protein